MEYLSNRLKNNRIPDAAWSIVDVFFVMLFVLVVGISISISMLALFGDTKLTSTLSNYIICLLALLTPILWLRKRLKLTKEVLGLKKANINMLSYALIVLITGIYHFILWTSESNHSIHFISRIRYSYLELLLLPLSIYSFATIVLAPIAEEIFWRGFVYGYLRTKIGIIFGLLLQALMFSLLHYNISVNIGTNVSSLLIVFMVGLIAGFIYERTGSIYPSMVLHCSFNYFSVINIAIHK